MASSPPEPSYQPNGQEQGLTQGRVVWQPATYTPPGGSDGGQAYAAAAPSYTPPEQPYPPQDQTVTSLPQGPSQGYQGYQPYQGYQAYGVPQGQGAAAPPPPPQWQAGTAAQPVAAQPVAAQPAAARTKLRIDKGLLGSLFDFSFTSMVTPKIIKALYVLFTIWTMIAAIGILLFFIHFGGAEGAIGGIIVDAIFILLSLGIYRVILEAFMVVFQIHGELKTIREQGENRD
jgi:Domain of unknown function (DUF4282)